MNVTPGGYDFRRRPPRCVRSSRDGALGRRCAEGPDLGFRRPSQASRTGASVVILLGVLPSPVELNLPADWRFLVRYVLNVAVYDL